MLPQLIVLAVTCLGVGLSLAQHGQSHKENAVSTLIGVVIQLGLLFWGGFFNCFWR